MKKTNKNNFLIITLVLLLFIPISYSFSGNKIGSDSYIEGNSPGKLGDKDFDNTQANLYMEDECDASRYTSNGFDIPEYGFEITPCSYCDGNGGVINKPVGTKCGLCKVCDSNGLCNGINTSWGGGSAYDCGGTDMRCFIGSCVRCNGYRYANACLYMGQVSDSCVQTCGGYGGCAGYYGHASIAVCEHFTGYSSGRCCNNAAHAPAWNPNYDACWLWSCNFEPDKMYWCRYVSHQDRRFCNCNK
ncbi:MAG: hypothetical protein U9O94_07210 [Nanoarchaeota archaeon]|nr:hypothetical protein [Nanoarchaeota archaeon]